MRIPGFVLLAVVLLAGAVRADDGAAARALIDAAVRAHGGEAALAKYPVKTVKTEGIFQGYDRTPVFFHTCETTTHGAEQYRMALNGDMQKQKFQIVNVLDGGRGWIKQAGGTVQDTSPCTPAQLANFQEGGYATWVATLVPLKGREFTLSPAGEQKHGERALAGVRVSNKGHRDVSLFFDKQSHLLVKTEERGTAGTGVEGKVETIRGRNKDVQGVQLPVSWEVYYNGRCLWSHHVTDYKLSEKPAPGTFAKP